MRLASKYNLILFMTLSVSLLAMSSIIYIILHKHAKAEVGKHARILMEAGEAMRKYTNKEIKPLLAFQNKRNFLPQSVPSYATTQSFNTLRETHPEYRYKEATLNPTNPRDRAADWEADIITEFRNNKNLSSLTVVRDTPRGNTLYFARPIRIKDPTCLNCHGMLEDAPKTLLAKYGSANGFGWQMNEVVGSQIVSVPLSLPVARANKTFLLLISVVAGSFVVLFILLNILLRRLFIRRIIDLAKSVEDVNQGRSDCLTAFNLTGNDEIAGLSESVEHMCIQREKANQMLGRSNGVEHGAADRSER